MDGVAIGSPIALMLADVFINYIIEEAFSALQQNRLMVLLRYVDGLFLVFSKHEEAQSFFGAINCIHKSINFYRNKSATDNLLFLMYLFQELPEI